MGKRGELRNRVPWSVVGGLCFLTLLVQCTTDDSDPHPEFSDGPGGGLDSGQGPDSGQGLDIDQGSAPPAQWVSIPAGAFTMGSPTSEACRAADEDAHPVTLTQGWLMQTTEVTQGAFEDRRGYNPAYFGPQGEGDSCGPDCPVEQVTWHEAVAYCNALSAEKGIDQCYTCTGQGADVTCQVSEAYQEQHIYQCPGYRLPTEAEWEYAYRAETQTPYYNGANDPEACACEGDTGADAIAWYCGNAHGRSHPVGLKQANAWDLYDLPGNVWESWVIS